MTVAESKLGWFAGLFDGEGSVCIEKNRASQAAGRPRDYYYLRCSVELTDLGALLLLAETFGGRPHPRKGSRLSRKPLYAWAISGVRARAFLTTILPHLVIKQREAEAALAWDGADGITMQAMMRAIRSLPRETMEASSK